MSAVEGVPSTDRRKRAGEHIRRARLALRWTQPEFAERVTAALRDQAGPGEAQTVGQSAVSRWELGVNAPEAWKLPAIEHVLAMPEGTLAGVLYDRPPATDRATRLEARLDRVEMQMTEMIELLRDLDRRIQGRSPGGDEGA